MRVKDLSNNASYGHIVVYLNSNKDLMDESRKVLGIAEENFLLWVELINCRLCIDNDKLPEKIKKDINHNLDVAVSTLLYKPTQKRVNNTKYLFESESIIVELIEDVTKNIIGKLNTLLPSKNHPEQLNQAIIKPLSEALEDFKEEKYQNHKLTQQLETKVIKPAIKEAQKKINQKDIIQKICKRSMKLLMSLMTLKAPDNHYLNGHVYDEPKLSIPPKNPLQSKKENLYDIPRNLEKKGKSKVLKHSNTFFGNTNLKRQQNVGAMKPNTYLQSVSVQEVTLVDARKVQGR